MKIFYEDNHLLVVEKPPNIPTQKDASKDKDMLTICKEYIKHKYNKPGNVYLGLVHRLDRPVGGIMVFAKTSKSASRLSNQIRLNQFSKEYIAVVHGNVKQATYVDYLYKDRRKNMSHVTTAEKGKKSILEILDTEYYEKDDLTKVKINLITGRSHQIRVQFPHRNHPLLGDGRYNHQSKPGQQIALWAYKISFNHPTTKKRLTFVSETPPVYPFAFE